MYIHTYIHMCCVVMAHLGSVSGCMAGCFSCTLSTVLYLVLFLFRSCADCRSGLLWPLPRVPNNRLPLFKCGLRCTPHLRFSFASQCTLLGRLLASSCIQFSTFPSSAAIFATYANSCSRIHCWWFGFFSWRDSSHVPLG
jgi:hypothetical protein